MSRTRRFYYWLVARLSSDVELVHNFTGFGLYDREVVEQFRDTEEQYPYFRGLVSDFGYERADHPNTSSRPASTGMTKNNFFSLYDMAMLGITSHSKVPLRLATMAGFALSIVSLVVAVGVPDPEADVVGYVQPRTGAARDRRLLLRCGPAVLHRDARRVHRLDPHAGPQATPRRGEGAHQLRLSSTLWVTASALRFHEPLGRDRIEHSVKTFCHVWPQEHVVVRHHVVNQLRQLPEICLLVIGGDGQQRSPCADDLA